MYFILYLPILLKQQNHDTSIDESVRLYICMKIPFHDFGLGHRMKLFQLFDLLSNPENQELYNNNFIRI